MIVTTPKGQSRHFQEPETTNIKEQGRTCYKENNQPRES